MKFNQQYQIKVSSDLLIGRLANDLSLQGYRIEDKTDDRLEVVQVSAPTNNRSGLLGAVSQLSATAKDNTLYVEARLTGYKKLFITLSLMMVIMFLGFLITFGFMLRPEGKTLWQAIMPVVLPFAPWPIFFPLMYRAAVSQSAKQLDVQLRNMCEFE
ncbi:MAG: hypothetical protein JW745_00040 [Sedimentisphaerales bacterium]|nr:hypothetical protein [Sedimentisphaerales bacterium]MBN2841937.1 hypothetical protein [Sedimentisphaerales bacterium]